MIVAENLTKDGQVLLPITGAGADLPIGTILIPGATGGTNYGVAIVGGVDAGASGKAIIGVLSELHDFSVVGDATTATLVNWFAPHTANPPSHMVALPQSGLLTRIPYSLASTVAVASASTKTLTITSFEANFDGGFIYVNAGTGIGQIEFVASSSSGSCVLSSTPTTEPDSTSKLTKILPYFYNTPVFLAATATVPQKLDSSAAAGTGRAVCLGNFISKNGLVERLDPKAHNDSNGYNNLSVFEIYSLMQFQNTIWSPNA